MAPHDSSENLAKLVEKMDKDCQCATNKKDKDGKSELNNTKKIDNIKLQLRSTSLWTAILELFCPILSDVLVLFLFV